MEIDRRAFLAGLSSAGVLAGLPAGVAQSAGGGLYVAARRDRNGRYAAVIFDPVRGDRTAVVLPGRGHGIALHPTRAECVVFARRPGSFAVAFGPRSGAAPIWFRAREGRHFYGHGVYSPDGRLLFATENNYEAGTGVIGVRDATDGYRWLGEFPGHGIGPHDMALLSDGRTLVVAVGGIMTHPETGRRPLNLPQMSPALVYLDSRTGDLVERHALTGDRHKLSVRHLAVAAGDRVVFGCQYQGPKQDSPPLIGFHRRGEALTLTPAPEAVARDARGYIGSVAVDRSGLIAAASSPRGGLVTYWETQTRRYLGRSDLEDCCGLAPADADGSFLVSSGTGRVRRMDALRTASDGEPATAAARAGGPDHAWDNHLALLG